MDDVTYRAKELKKISNSARRMNRTGKGPIRFPSDYLTNKEKKAMNGECKTYKLDGPCTWAEFKSMPHDIQCQWVNRQKESYGVNYRMLGQLFGAHQSSVSKYFAAHKLPSCNGQSRINGRDAVIREAKWEAFCNGVVGGGSRPDIEESRAAVAEIEEAVTEIEKEVSEEIVSDAPEYVENFDVSFGATAEMEYMLNFISKNLTPGTLYRFQFRAIAE